MGSEDDMFALMVKIGADVSSVNEALEDVKTDSKQAAKELSFVGLMSKKVMLEVGRSSIIASMYMEEFHAAMGLMIDVLLEPFMPMIDELMESIWFLVDAFEGLSGQEKDVVTAITAIVVAMYLVSAHPIVAVIIVMILAFKWWSSETDKTKASLNLLLVPLGSLVAVFRLMEHVLTGGSLVPAFESLASVLELSVLPYVKAGELAFEGMGKGIDLVTSGVGFLVDKLVDLKNAVKDIPGFDFATSLVSEGGIGGFGGGFSAIKSGLGI